MFPRGAMNDLPQEKVDISVFVSHPDKGLTAHPGLARAFVAMRGTEENQSGHVPTIGQFGESMKFVEPAKVPHHMRGADVYAFDLPSRGGRNYRIWQRAPEFSATEFRRESQNEVDDYFENDPSYNENRLSQLLRGREREYTYNIFLHEFGNEQLLLLAPMDADGKHAQIDGRGVAYLLRRRT